jgi:hypothetical protein
LSRPPGVRGPSRGCRCLWRAPLAGEICGGLFTVRNKGRRCERAASSRTRALGSSSSCDRGDREASSGRLRGGHVMVLTEMSSEVYS